MCVIKLKIIALTSILLSRKMFFYDPEVLETAGNLHRGSAFKG